MTLLDEVHDHYRCQIGLLDHLEERAMAGHDAFLHKVAFPAFRALPGAVGARRLAMRRTIIDLRRSVHDSAFLAMVAAFERTLFDAISRAGREVRATVEASYPEDQPLHGFRTGFVKDSDDFYNRGGIRALFAHHPVTAALATRIAHIIDYRDFLAHGRRVKLASVRRIPEPPTVDSAKTVFDQILPLL